MSKIEEVARAICENVTAASPDDIIPEHPHGSRKRWQAYEYAARAAIEAMREPEVEMIAAFWRQKNCGTQEVGQVGDARSDYGAWRAAIDAALNEQVTG